MSLDVLQMAACMLEIWTRAQRPTSTFSFGYQRHAVLARCTVAVVTMFVATFLGKEGFEAVLVPGQTPSTFQFSHGVAAVSVFALRALNMSMARHVHRGTASAGVAVHPLSTPSKLQQRHRGAELLASGTVTTIIVLASIFGSIPGKVAFWAGYGAIANACFLAWLAAPVLRCNARILLQTAPRELLGPIAKALREVGPDT